MVLNPRFVLKHDAATVAIRDIKNIPELHGIMPFQAALEFKLDHRGWSKGRADGIIETIGKLNLSNEAPLRYLVVLIRYCSPSLIAWDRHWSTITEAANRYSLFANQECFCCTLAECQEWYRNSSLWGLAMP